MSSFRILLLGLFLSTQALAGSVLFLKGQVFKNGEKLQRGNSVKYGDQIVTEDDSMVIIKNDGATIKMKANSEVVIRKFKSKKNKYSIVRYLLNRGELFFKGKGSKKKKFQVHTKVATMGVRGTEFFTSYSGDKNKEVWMCVNEGEVEVEMIVDGKSDSLTVEKGQGIFIKSSKLPKARAYKWTRKLNWNMGEGKKNIQYDQVKGKVNIKEVAYPLEDIDYD